MMNVSFIMRTASSDVIAMTDADALPWKSRRDLAICLQHLARGVVLPG
jgi:hypothetical protein